MKRLFLAIGDAAVAYERTGWPGARLATRLAGQAFWHGLSCQWGGIRRIESREVLR